MSTTKQLKRIAQQIRALPDSYDGRPPNGPTVGGRLVAEAIALDTFSEIEHLTWRVYADQKIRTCNWPSVFEIFLREHADINPFHQFGEACDVVADAIDAQAEQPTEVGETASDHDELMSEGERSVWDALGYRAALAKELAADPNVDAQDDDSARQYVHRLRSKGYHIEHQRGRGYYRPDAPPDDLIVSE